MVLNLSVCELYTPLIHGKTNNSSQDIMGNYIIIENLALNEFYNFSYLNIIHMAKRVWLNALSLVIINRNNDHPFIDNFQALLARKDIVSLDIVEVKTLEGGEMVGIKKTFWLKIIQRLYKRVYKERLGILQLRKSPHSLYYKKINGKWPKYCRRMPEYTFL